jgi:hypothetical protein
MVQQTESTEEEIVEAEVTEETEPQKIDFSGYHLHIAMPCYGGHEQYV